METPGRGRWAPQIAIASMLALMAAAMRLEGRLWISKSGAIKLWHADVWSSECSQQIADPYSLTHASHGLLFALLFAWLGGLISRRTAWKPAADPRWHLTLAVFLAAGWEVLENSAFIINRYREVTMSLDYLGDTILNSTGDVLCCIAGFAFARRMGAWWTLAAFAASELLLLWMIRDNLTLNIVMLITPVQAIREWQTAGAPIPLP